MTVSWWVVTLAVVALVNPARVALGTPGGMRSRADRLVMSAGGTAGGAAVLALVVLAGPSLVEWWSVSPPTWRVAAGLVAAIAGLWALVSRRPDPEPSLPGRRGAVVPVAVPLVLRPELALVVASAGADGRVGAAFAGLGLAVVAVLAAVALSAPHQEPTGTTQASGASAGRTFSVADRVLVWLGRIAGVIAVAAGIALAVSGVLDV